MGSRNDALQRQGVQRGGLPQWRLQRVVDVIEARIDHPLTLADLAACAGLSRMHFAAQFRLAMSVTPHDYVVCRRIEHARRLLRETNLPLAQIALAVGFQSQAHFTTVFRRQLNETPWRWRRREQCRIINASHSEEGPRCVGVRK